MYYFIGVILEDVVRKNAVGIRGDEMLFASIIIGIFSSLSLVTFEIGELAFFVILAILSIAVVVKIIKNKKSRKSNS